MMNKIPKYIKLFSNAIYVDWKLFEKSPEYEQEREKTKELVRYLNDERTHKKTSNRGCF